MYSQEDVFRKPDCIFPCGDIKNRLSFKIKGKQRCRIPEEGRVKLIMRERRKVLREENESAVFVKTKSNLLIISMIGCLKDS